MVLGEGVYGPVITNYHNELWGVSLTIVHQTIQGPKQISYYGEMILA